MYKRQIAESLDVTFTYASTEKPFLHPYQAVDVLCEGEVIGYFGKLAYDIQDELNMRTSASVSYTHLLTKELQTAVLHVGRRNTRICSLKSGCELTPVSSTATPTAGFRLPTCSTAVCSSFVSPI